MDCHGGHIAGRISNLVSKKEILIIFLNHLFDLDLLCELLPHAAQW